jgi:hypothetical protein
MAFTPLVGKLLDEILMHIIYDSISQEEIDFLTSSLSLLDRAMPAASDAVSAHCMMLLEEAPRITGSSWLSEPLPRRQTLRTYFFSYGNALQSLTQLELDLLDASIALEKTRWSFASNEYERISRDTRNSHNPMASPTHLLRLADDAGETDLSLRIVRTQIRLLIAALNLWDESSDHSQILLFEPFGGKPLLQSQIDGHYLVSIEADLKDRSLFGRSFSREWRDTPAGLPGIRIPLTADKSGKPR